MREYIVTKIILFLLNSGAGVDEHKLSTNSRCHIFGLAKAITKHIKNDSDIAALVAIGYKESKFNYKAKRWFTSPNGKHCGIYQQSPQFAILDGRKLNCRDLQSNDTATDQALSYIHYVIDTYGRSWDNICHYNSGNECNDGSRRYAKDFKHKYDKTISMLKGKNKKFNDFVISDYDSYAFICGDH
jgi:hypothetical protein